MQDENTRGPDTVAVVGGTGFVGSHIVEALHAEGYDVRMLVRPGSDEKIPDLGRTTRVDGDIGSDAALRQLLQGADAAIYLVGILRAEPGKGVTFENTQLHGAERCASIAAEAGCRRFLLMSANGVDAEVTAYQRTKREAERRVASLELDWTVFRPSVIFGDPRGRMEFATQLYRDMVRLPLPAVGFRVGWNPAGEPVRMAPVHVDDVAAAFVGALSDASTIGKTFELCGPEVLTWDEMIERVAAAVGRKKLLLPVPTGLMRVAATLLDWLPPFPVTRDQLTMLEQSNVCRENSTAGRIGHEPRRFDADSLGYLRGTE